MELKGKLNSYSVVKTGVKDGKEWTLYKYKLNTVAGERTLSGFLDPKPYLNKIVIMDYTESENPDPKFPPYKNVSNITEDVATKESDQQYNISPVGTTKETESPAFFGMVSNQAMNYILAKMEKEDYSYQKNFSLIFDIIWEENIKKRKEKLGG